MSIEITQTSHDKIWVNHKLVIRDINGNWVASEELLPSEQTALNQWLRAQGEI